VALKQSMMKGATNIVCNSFLLSGAKQIQITEKTVMCIIKGMLLLML